MSNIFKIFKGYTPYEKKMSAFLSASPYPPTTTELAEMYRLFISTYRIFTDLHLLLTRHLVGLDNATKFLRGIYFLSFVFTQLYPLRNQGVCEDLIELDLHDSQPIPPASLFLYLHIQTLEAFDIFRSVQYYGNRVEIAHTKKSKNNTSQAVLNSTHLLDDTTNNAIVHNDTNENFTNSIEYDSESSINTRSSMEVSSGNLLPSTAQSSDPQFDPQFATSSSTETMLVTTLQSTDLTSNINAGTSGVKYLCPPGGFITSLYELYSKLNISIATPTAKFILQLQSYSLSSNPDGHSLQQIDYSGNGEPLLVSTEITSTESPLIPSMLPPSLRSGDSDKTLSPVVPTGPPPSLRKVAPQQQQLQQQQQQQPQKQRSNYILSENETSELLVFNKK